MTKVTRNGLPAAKQDVSYTYDMHGWLQKIVTNSFTEELYYASDEGTKYYNGNISSIMWKDNTSTSYRGYKYTYDIANRMTAAPMTREFLLRQTWTDTVREWATMPTAILHRSHAMARSPQAMA